MQRVGGGQPERVVVVVQRGRLATAALQRLLQRQPLLVRRAETLLGYFLVILYLYIVIVLIMETRLWRRGTSVLLLLNLTVVGSLLTRWNFLALLTRQSAALSLVNQHAMSQKFSRKWGMKVS